MPVDQTLKGKETGIPTGSGFSDKDGILEETEIRLKWWEDPCAQNVQINQRCARE
jgi:hypothetical protein